MVIWALPVLGLVGTVLGIADAVGGFANFLGQDVSEVAQIRVKLVEVTGGLSFAFLITLQGLITSLIVMLIVSTLQNGEDRLFSAVHRDIAEIFIPALQRAVPQETGPGRGVAVPEELRAALADAIFNIESTGTQLLLRMEQTGQAVIKAVAAPGEAVIAQIARERTAHLEELKGMLTDIQAGMSATAAAMTQVVARQSGIAEVARTAIAEIETMVRQIAATQATVGDSLARIEKLNTDQILGDVRRSIDALHPVLTRFQQPFVLQAVPASPI